MLGPAASSCIRRSGGTSTRLPPEAGAGVPGTRWRYSVRFRQETRRRFVDRKSRIRPLGIILLLALCCFAFAVLAGGKRICASGQCSCSKSGSDYPIPIAGLPDADRHRSDSPCQSGGCGCAYTAADANLPPAILAQKDFSFSLSTEFLACVPSSGLALAEDTKPVRIGVFERSVFHDLYLPSTGGIRAPPLTA